MSIWTRKPFEGVIIGSDYNEAVITVVQCKLIFLYVELHCMRVLWLDRLLHVIHHFHWEGSRHIKHKNNYRGPSGKFGKM